jgi:phosphoglycerol geranylgeranyltransferase
MTVQQRLFGNLQRRARYVVLLDPDKLDAAGARRAARACSRAGVDALFVGGSTLRRNGDFRRLVAVIRRHAAIPVILFPGSARQIVPSAHAVLFMSLLSGRNPRYLIEEQVKGAETVRRFGLETISLGYLLISSGRSTAVERKTGTRPLARNDPAGAARHALAAQYLGMSAVYLEAGSGAGRPVPAGLIRRVRAAVAIPLIVGGGIKTPAEARRKVRAGADIVVTGNVLENDAGFESSLRRFAAAVHGAR